jgi:hypothetical protein
VAETWARPHFAPSKDRAWLDLVMFTRDKPALDVDLGEEDGFPPGFDFPRTISVRTASIAEHRDAYAEYLEGPFRELAADQLGAEASKNIDDARWTVTISGSVPDPPNLALVQAVRAFERYMARTASGIAIANDLSLRWQDAASIATSDPPNRLRVDEWIEVLYDDEVKGLHTRGMEQFARPDVAVFDLPEHRLERASQLLRHLAHLQAHGTLYPDRTTIKVDPADSRTSERITVALERLDADRCKSLAVRDGTLVVQGWPGGLLADAR